MSQSYGSKSPYSGTGLDQGVSPYCCAEFSTNRFTPLASGGSPYEDATLACPTVDYGPRREDGQVMLALRVIRSWRLG